MIVGLRALFLLAGGLYLLAWLTSAPGAGKKQVGLNATG